MDAPCHISLASFRSPAHGETRSRTRHLCRRKWRNPKLPAQSRSADALRTLRSTTSSLSTAPQFPGVCPSPNSIGQKFVDDIQVQPLAISADEELTLTVLVRVNRCMRGHASF